MHCACHALHVNTSQHPPNDPPVLKVGTIIVHVVPYTSNGKYPHMLLLLEVSILYPLQGFPLGRCLRVSRAAALGHLSLDILK